MLSTEGAPDPARSGERTETAGIRPEHRARFEQDGFIVLDGPIATVDEVAEVRAIVDLLLPLAPARNVRDLGRGGPDEGRIIEIEEATELAPALRRTAVFQRCRRLTSELLGVPTAPYYDHVIRKPAHNLAATSWHQDSAYAARPDRPVPPTAHVWLALQPATVANGCMQFLPGSHRTPVVHRPRGGDPAADALEAVDVDHSVAVACPLPVGGATIHHPGVLHHTGPNTTDDERVAWILQFRQEGSWGVRAVVPGPVRQMMRRNRHSRT